MSFRRYIAANSRDALAQVRRELGDDAVILSNRRVPEGHEVVAAAARTMERIVQDAPATHVRAPAPPRTVSTASAVPERVQEMRVQEPRAQTLTIQPNESFQEFVRRQSQMKAAVKNEASKPAAAPAVTAPTKPAAPRVARAEPVESEVEMTPVPTAAARYRDVAQATVADEAEEDLWKPTTFHVPEAAPAAPKRSASELNRNSLSESLVPKALAASAERGAADHGASNRLPTRWVASDKKASLPPTAPAVFRRRAQAPGAEPEVTPAKAVMPQPPEPQSPAPQLSATQSKVLEELQAMREQLQQQLASLSSTVAANRQQLHSQITQSLSHLSHLSAQTQQGAPLLPARVISRLLTAGFSPEVARKLAQHVPVYFNAAEAESWLQDAITMNLKTVPEAEGIVEMGGAYALVGPTGVGKTTTVAKLAARFAMKYGSGALGLITLDAYRVGAHEQLRAYGRILGTPVHLAQDSATLRELLVALQNKRLVLIDTCGMSPRDDRINEVLDMIATANAGVPEAMRVQRVLLTHAASQAETLYEAARAWRASECAGCVLTKLDEAARIGGALDTALRYKLRLFGVTNGQRVPEDWHGAQARVLTHLALRPGADTFALENNEALAVTERTAPARAATASASNA